jgi:hypothetical protein
MAGLEAPWLAMVSSPEREERRREKRSSGVRCWLRGGGKGGCHRGGAAPQGRLGPCLLPVRALSVAFMRKKRKQRREKRKEERVGEKRKGEKMGKKSNLDISGKKNKRQFMVFLIIFVKEA